MSRTNGIVSAALILATCGCGGSSQPQPAFAELVPVGGSVTRGPKTVSGGILQFFPDPKNDDFLCNCEVGPNGTFAVTTVRTTDSRGERKPGLAPGKYKIVYRPPLGNQAEGGSQDTLELPNPVTVSGPTTDMKIDLLAAKKK